MDPLKIPLRTRPIQTGREMLIEPYPNWQCGFIDDPDHRSRTGSVPTRTRIRSDGPQPLLTLILTEFTNYTFETWNEGLWYFRLGIATSHWDWFRLLFHRMQHQTSSHDVHTMRQAAKWCYFPPARWAILLHVLHTNSGCN